MIIWVNAGRSAPKLCEHLLELRHHEDQQDRADQERHRDDRRRVEQRLLDLALQALDVFLVGGDRVEHGVQHAGRFAGLDQVAVQLVELHRVLAQRLATATSRFRCRRGSR